MGLTAVLTPAEEGGYVALNPETGTTTQGKTVEEAVANLREATALYLHQNPDTPTCHPTGVPWAPAQRTPRMLSYRHAFHAGNDVDVFKHVALCALISALERKDKPFLYVETHAGAGFYTRRSRRAQETSEAALGIRLLWPPMGVDPLQPALATYLSEVQRCNGTGGLKRYPGSPWFAQALLRAADRAVLAELHPVDHGKLVRLLRGDKRMTVVQQDGYALLRALLPPIERRALVFIDPSYETRDELGRLHAALVDGRQRFANGVYAIWYPVGTKHAADSIVAHVTRAARTGVRPSKTLDIRWERAQAHVRGDATEGLRGAGLVIINPPFGLDETLPKELEAVVARLEPGARRGRVRAAWTVPESA